MAFLKDVIIVERNYDRIRDTLFGIQALQIWNGTGNYTLRELKNVGEDFLNGVRQFVSFTSMIIDTVTDQPKKRRIVV
jgi:hypothetical protein